MGSVPFLKFGCPGSIYKYNLFAMPFIATMFNFMVLRSISSFEVIFAVVVVIF